MRTIHLKSWEKFLSTIEKIRTEYSLYKNVYDATLKNWIFFRGQADAKWRLETTLERVSNETWSVYDYGERVLRCAPRIDSFLEKVTDLTRWEDLGNEITKNTTKTNPFIPDYSYWVYLRHHGFPSPLMDWTMSPYIAAFFAFAEYANAKNSSIYVLIISRGEITKENKHASQITFFGPDIRTHKRHFLQQSWYTVSTKYINKQHEFHTYGESIEEEENGRDILIKITLPRSERKKILANLKECNINFFSLFHTEEALIKTLAHEYIENVIL